MNNEQKGENEMTKGRTFVLLMVLAGVFGLLSISASVYLGVHDWFQSWVSIIAGVFAIIGVLCIDTVALVLTDKDLLREMTAEDEQE